MAKRPRTRNTFRNEMDELNYLNDIISYWFYRKEDASRAILHCERFGELLARRDFNDGSITLQEHWALLHEVRGDVERAIIHREREIALIHRLLAIGCPEGPIDYKYLINKILALDSLRNR